MDTVIRIKNEALSLLNLFLQNPVNPFEKWTAAALAILACAWVFLKVGDRLDLPNVGVITSFIYTGLGVTIVFAAMGAARIFLPDFQKQFGDILFYSAVAVIVSVAVVVPLINMFINGKYLGTLASWSIGVVTALVAVALLSNIFAYIHGGERVFDRGRQHNETTKEMLK
jgi:hypothetical protein